MSKHRQEQRREKQRRHAQTQREIARKAEKTQELSESFKDLRASLAKGGWLDSGAVKSGPSPNKFHKNEIPVGGLIGSGRVARSLTTSIAAADLQNWPFISDSDVRAAEEPAPTFSQCVIGYRQWVIDALGQLRAFTMFQQIWKPGINEAACRAMDTSSGRTLRDLPLIAAEEHQAPHADCHCGLYGWNDLAPPTLGCANLDSIGRVIVYGAIAAWGDLQVHATGFRASHACTVALAYDDETEPRVLDLLLRVADEYRVRLVHVDALQAEAEQHGMPLPDDARPPAVDMWSFFHRGIAQSIQISPAQWKMLGPS